MNKKIFIIFMLTFLLVGCGLKYSPLGDDAIAFKVKEYTYSNDSYLAIEYNDRIYIPYGNLKYDVSKKDINKCIGYIVQDENVTSIPSESDTTRVYTLTDDPDENYLMVYYIETTLMNQLFFYRAVDTFGKEIKTPKFIDTNSYGY